MNINMNILQKKSQNYGKKVNILLKLNCKIMKKKLNF